MFYLQKLKTSIFGTLFLWWISDMKKRYKHCRVPFKKHSCQVWLQLTNGLEQKIDMPNVWVTTTTKDAK
jgi:hypothetical protein